MAYPFRPVLIIVLACLWMQVNGCRVRREQPQVSLPARSELIRDQLIFHTNFRLPRRHRLVERLARSRETLTTTLKLPTSDEPIHVFLFENESRYRLFLRHHHPYLPDRRAFFVKRDTSLNIFAHWGDRVAEDLQHEVIHGYLHSVVPDVPLWIDEGLAEFYEVGLSQRGVNRPHILLLASEFKRGNWKPDLARLETIQDPAKLSKLDYAEAWLWVHLLLESDQGRQRELLSRNLETLRTSGESPKISQQLKDIYDRPDETVLQHLKRLAERL